MPTYDLLTASEIGPGVRYQRSWLADGCGSGWLPANYNPSIPRAKSPAARATTPAFKPPPLLDNMTLKLPADRLEDRRQLLGQLDRLSREVDAFADQEALDKYRLQAYDVLRTGVARRST